MAGQEMNMVEWKRGVKAGLLAGLIYGLFKDTVIFAVGPSFFAEVLPGLFALYGFGVTLLFALIAIGIGTTFGGILGLVYAAGYDVLPGSSVTSGWMIGLILWLIELVLSFAFIGVVYYMLVTFLLAVFIYGSFLGYFWDPMK